MKIRKKIPISFNFSNSTAEMVKKFYESHEYKHSTIYLAGIEALKQKETDWDKLTKSDQNLLENKAKALVK